MTRLKKHGVLSGKPKTEKHNYNAAQEYRSQVCNKPQNSAGEKILRYKLARGRDLIWRKGRVNSARRLQGDLAVIKEPLKGLGGEQRAGTSSI